MKSRNLHTIFLSVLALLVFTAFGYAPSNSLPMLLVEGNSFMTVSVFNQGAWQTVGALAFDKTPSERKLDLFSLNLTGSRLILRVENQGQTAAHIDAALLGGYGPIQVNGTDEEPSLALQKLSQPDSDLVDARSKSLTLVYELPSERNRVFALTARIEPERISEAPFQFPTENTFQPMTTNSAFYSYSWDSHPGMLTIDGDFAGENLGSPFFQEFCLTGSGHPNGYTYGWVSNDDQFLYVAIEFVPDNTLDGDKDYTKVYVKTDTGLRSFKVSVPDQEWGKPGFTYTSRAVYQHKTYEFAIPRDELGVENLAPGDPLSLAFAAYGTGAPPPPDSFPGPLDPTFSGDGIQTTDFGAYETAFGMALQNDGKIVVVGKTLTNFALARYTPDGDLDNSFNGTGKQITNIGGTDQADAVAIQVDQKILAAGTSDNNFALVRYNTDGSLDGSFGTGGIVTTTFGVASSETGRDIAIQNDGKIILVGNSDADFAIARYLDNGNLDPLFSGDGKQTADLGGSDYGFGVAIQGDGNIVVVGMSSGDIALVRFTPNGALDNTFGNLGIQITDIVGTDYGYDVAIQKDHKIVVAGICYGVGSGDFTLVLYNQNGTIDTTFNGIGWRFSNFNSQDAAKSLLIHPDGTYIAAGASGYYPAVTRIMPNGSMDHTFGLFGKANTIALGFQAYGEEVALQMDGKIVVAGYTRTNDFAVLRYNPPRIFLPVVMK